MQGKCSFTRKDVFWGHPQRDAGMCQLVLLIPFTWQWISLCRWLWQSVIIRKAVSYTSVVPVFHLHSSNFLQLPPSPRLSGCLLMSLFSVSLYAVSWQILSCHPRTPEAICQFQLESCVHRTLVTQSNSPVIVGHVCEGLCVCSLTDCMIDATFRHKQIIQINLARQKAFKLSSIHELTRLSAFVTGRRIATSNHWTRTHTHTQAALFYHTEDLQEQERRIHLVS